MAQRLTRRQLQARARTVVLGALALFVLAQLGLRGYIDWLRPELRDPTFEIKYRRFTELKERTDPPAAGVVFMGSSMTVFGVDAGAVDEPLSKLLGRPVVGYNLGAAGSGPFTQLLFLKRMLRRGAKPDYVVLEVAALTYSHEDPFREMKHFPGQMLSRYDLRTVTRYAPAPDAIRRDWLEACLVPIHGHRLTLMSQTAQILVPPADRLELWPDNDAHGFRRMSTPAPGQHAQTLRQVRATFQPQLARYKVGVAQVRALRELADLLAKERIPTIMAWMPEGPLMRSFYPARRMQELRAEFELVSHAHRFPLVDARCWLREGDFWDSVHMTETGGRAFTARLVHQAMLPWLERSRNVTASASPWRSRQDQKCAARFVLDASILKAENKLSPPN